MLNLLPLPPLDGSGAVQRMILMNKFDRDVRLSVYRHFVSGFKAPTVHEVPKDLNIEV